MVMGPCQFMTCRSLLGSGFRANFRVGSADNATIAQRETLLCSEHEPIARQLRDNTDGCHLVMSPEGRVYSDFWMNSLASRRK